jgi:hypothetical protein
MLYRFLPTEAQQGACRALLDWYNLAKVNASAAEKRETRSNNQTQKVSRRCVMHRSSGVRSDKRAYSSAFLSRCCLFQGNLVKAKMQTVEAERQYLGSREWRMVNSVNFSTLYTSKLM